MTTSGDIRDRRAEVVTSSVSDDEPWTVIVDTMTDMSATKSSPSVTASGPPAQVRPTQRYACFKVVCVDYLSNT